MIDWIRLLFIAKERQCRANHETDCVRARNRNETSLQIGHEERRPADCFISDLGHEQKNTDTEQKIFDPIARLDGALHPPQGKESEKRGVEPRETAIARELGYEEKNVSRDRERRPNRAKNESLTVHSFAQRAEPDEWNQVPEEMFEGEVCPVAGDQLPELSGGDAVAAVLEMNVPQGHEIDCHGYRAEEDGGTKKMPPSCLLRFSRSVSLHFIPIPVSFSAAEWSFRREGSIRG